MEKKYYCGCGKKCNSELDIHYLGKDEINKENPEKSKLRNLYVVVSQNREDLLAEISMEKIPEIVRYLQEAYEEFQEVQETLESQGKLEELSKKREHKL